MADCTPIATIGVLIVLPTAIVAGVVSISWATQARQAPASEYDHDQATPFPDRVVPTWADDPTCTQSVA